MDTRFLESLVTVADCGSLAEAARRLNLTPAGVTQRIRALESEIGVPLVFRSGRAVRPTEAAAAILNRARGLLGELRDLKAIAASGDLSGELRLGVMQTTLSGMFPQILIPFTRAYAGRLIDGYLRKAGIQPKERYELDGLELIAVMVDRGLGVSLLPDWAPPWPEGLSLRKLPLPDRSFKRRTGLLWARASLRARLIQAFLEQALVALGKSGAPSRGKRKAAR